MPRAPHPTDPALASLGLACAAATLVDGTTLASGGLATVTTAAVVAMILGAPAAVSEWKSPRLDTSQGVAERGLVSAWGVLIVGAAAGGWVHAMGWRGGGMAVVAWLAAGALARWASVGGAIGLLAVAVATVTALVGLRADPWTLLEPHWDAIGTWGPAAVVLGLLLSLAGLGQWTVGPVRRPGQRRAPWAPVGAGLLMAVALSVRSATAFETTVGANTSDAAVPWLVAAAVFAGACTVCARSGPSGWTLALLGGITTAWFAGPAHGALPFWWHGVLPLGLAASLSLVARRQSGVARVSAGLAAATALGAGVWGWPGVPERTADAAAAGGLLVVAFWLVATHATRTTRPTRTGGAA